MSRKLPSVTEEPEPVSRVWAQVREELNIYVFHADRQRIFDIVAHELAEQLREVCTCGEMGQCNCPCADAIDPEVKR